MIGKNNNNFEENSCQTELYYLNSYKLFVDRCRLSAIRDSRHYLPLKKLQILSIFHLLDKLLLRCVALSCINFPKVNLFCIRPNNIPYILLMFDFD